MTTGINKNGFYLGYDEYAVAIENAGQRTNEDSEARHVSEQASTGNMMEMFRLFTVECDRLVSLFGLYGWDIQCKLDNLEDDVTAGCTSFFDDRVALLTLNKNCSDVLTGNSESVVRAAHHEVLELLLARCATYMQNNNVESHYVDEALHEVIHVIMNCMNVEDKEDNGVS